MHAAVAAKSRNYISRDLSWLGLLLMFLALRERANQTVRSIGRQLVTSAQEFIINVLRTGPSPRHIAFIMDGNRRFSRQHNMQLVDGHTKGAEALMKVLATTYLLAITHVTVYAFSIENFNRPQEEVDTLFELLRGNLAKLVENESSFAHANHVQVRIVGNKTYIPEDILEQLEEIERKTNKPDSIKVLNVCFPYTSRDDITEAVKKSVGAIVTSETEKDAVTENWFQEQMYLTPDTPPLDILIRTSGYTRLSDFMLWQCNDNCEIDFVQTLWPDFGFMQLLRIFLRWGWQHSSFGIWKTFNSRSSMSLQQLPPAPPLISVLGK